MNLPKELRLKSSEVVFLKTKYPDQSSASQYFKLKFYSNKNIKFAFIISKKFLNKSTNRNFLRRRLKANLFDKYTKGVLKEGFYVFILKKEFKKEELTNENIINEVNQVLSKIS